MKKLKILFIIITVIIVIVVGLLIFKNYYPDNAASIKSSASVKSVSLVDNSLKLKRLDNKKLSVNRISPLKTDTEDDKAQSLDKPRLFDDVITATETFSPLIVPFITFYLYTKKKKIDKNLKAAEGYQMKDLKELIEEEQNLAVSKYGKFSSPHEAYSVIKEELEELKESIDRFEDQFILMWNSIRNKEFDEMPGESALQGMERESIDALKEGIQVASMTIQLIQQRQDWKIKN